MEWPRAPDAAPGCFFFHRSWTVPIFLPSSRARLSSSAADGLPFLARVDGSCQLAPAFRTSRPHAGAPIPKGLPSKGAGKLGNGPLIGAGSVPLGNNIEIVRSRLVTLTPAPSIGAQVVGR